MNTKLYLWNYPYICKDPLIRYSGWKLYIYGETVEDANEVSKLIGGLCTLYDCTYKIATQSIINRNKKVKPAWGIAVIYLNSSLFFNDPKPSRSINGLLSNLKYKLESYEVSGMYSGAKRVTRNLSYRYDLSIPVNPKVGIDYDDCRLYYRGEFGDYNIIDNYEPYQLINYIIK